MKRLFRGLSSSMILRKAAGLAAILLTYGGVFLAYYLLRDLPFIPNPPPFDPKKLFPFDFNQLATGFSLQITILPLLLLFLLSYWPHFRRLMQDQTSPHATPQVFLALAAVQLIAQTYELWLSRSTGQPFFLGTFLVFIGSLIGGWRIGLPLGVISLAYQSAFEHLTMTTMLGDIRVLGPVEYLAHFQWRQFFVEGVLNPHFSSGLWTAVFASLAADWIGPRRFSPLWAAVMGAVLEYAVGYLRYAAGIVQDLGGLPAQALVTGFAAVLVMLMLRTLQLEASRRKAAEAELSRMQAELRALRAQINPHFFFNALNTIRYMIREDPQKARDLMIDLSDIFQRTLRSGDFVPLRDELGYVAAYFSLEKARLGDRLRIVWGGLLRPEDPLKTDSPLLDLPVPTLALQPIVENAVIHGIGQKKEGGTVSVAVDRQKQDLIITIGDDGIGMDSGQKAGLLNPAACGQPGIGMKNVDARLRRLYGPEYGLAVESEPGKGTRVTVRVPVREWEEKK
jgi:hypothetical protein